MDKNIIIAIIIAIAIMFIAYIYINKEPLPMAFIPQNQPPPRPKSDNVREDVKKETDAAKAEVAEVLANKRFYS